MTEVSLEGIEFGEHHSLEIFNEGMPFFIQADNQWYTVDAQGNIEPIAGDPRIPEQFWDLDLNWWEIFGWVSAGG